MYDALDRLEEIAAELEVRADGESIARLLKIADRLRARSVALLGEFDAWGGWELDDAATLPAWLSQRSGCSRPEANRLTATARRLHQLPVTRDAYVNGKIGGGHVDAVVGNTTERTTPLFAEQEARWVPTLAGLDARGAVVFMQRWAISADAVLADQLPHEPEQTLHASRTIGNRLIVDASLVAGDADDVERALQLADSGDLSVGVAERRAEALAVVCRFYLDHQQTKLGGRHRPHVNIVIDVDRLHDKVGARTIDGVPVDAATAAQLCCDAAVHRVVMSGSSTILEYCRATRVVSASQYSALALRDGGCRFPGCNRSARYAEAHHIWAWEDGGPTDLSNVVLLCSRHHHRCHRQRYELELLPNGDLHVTKPDATVLVSTRGVT